MNNPGVLYVVFYSHQQHDGNIQNYDSAVKFE